MPLQFICPATLARLVSRPYLLVLLVLLFSQCTHAQAEPDVGRKRVIWVGEVVANNHMFIDMLGTDPRFQLVGTVPCTILVLGIRRGGEVRQDLSPEEVQRPCLGHRRHDLP